MIDKANRIKGGFFGLICGDALGVPVEFKSRSELKEMPVREMQGNGTHNQPPGTWSDDSSMLLATIDALYSSGYKPMIMLDKFCEWLFENKYTPHGIVFDHGPATARALSYYKEHKTPCTEYDEFSNGNGSLMRILPISLVFHKLPVEDIVKINTEVSALTHGHIRSCIACAYYSLMIRHVMEEKDLKTAYTQANKEILKYIPAEESARFARITGGKLAILKEKDIKSSGYVIDTLEAALWCCMKTDNFEDAVLKAVNLGEDTDTVAAVAGGLAGAFYGVDEVPEKWINFLAKLEELKIFLKKLVRAEENLPYHYKLIRSVRENVGDKLKGIGVKKVSIAHSNVGGVSNYDYTELIGKPAKLDDVLDFFNGMIFHGARLTLENGWVLNIDAYKGFKCLDKLDKK